MDNISLVLSFGCGFKYFKENPANFEKLIHFITLIILKKDLKRWEQKKVHVQEKSVYMMIDRRNRF